MLRWFRRHRPLTSFWVTRWNLSLHPPASPLSVFSVRSAGPRPPFQQASSPVPRLPTGALILGMQSLAGESVRERRREERRERHELRLAEW